MYVRRESNRRPDPTATHLLGQLHCVVARARRSTERVLLFVGEAAVADLFLNARLFALTRVADQHPESFGECSDLALPVVRGDVVDGDAFLTAEAEVDHLRNALECPVARAEVEVCGPVVAEVLAVVARCAR